MDRCCKRKSCFCAWEIPRSDRDDRYCVVTGNRRERALPALLIPARIQ